MAGVADIFERGLRLHQGGNLNDAEQLYRQVLQDEPTHAEAYHALGILLCQSGRTDGGIVLLRQAVALNPAVPLYHFSLGTVLKELQSTGPGPGLFSGGLGPQPPL